VSCLFIMRPALAVPPEGLALLLSVTHQTYADGGPDKDGIASIDEPHFGNAARAYPQRILVWYEIVNDNLGDDGPQRWPRSMG
jgi:hypothetical protein